MDKTKSERGYTGTGRLITRALRTLAGVYPLSGRFVNDSEWNDQSMSATNIVSFRSATDYLVLDFQANHDLSWGKMYDVEDVAINWHGSFSCGWTGWVI